MRTFNTCASSNLELNLFAKWALDYGPNLQERLPIAVALGEQVEEVAWSSAAISCGRL